MLRPRRVLISALILLFWGGMMGWLLYKEVLLPGMQTLPAAVKAPALPADYWMGIYVSGDQRAGFINLRTAPDTRDKVPGSRIDISAHAQLNLFGYEADITVTGNGWLAEDNRSAFFDYLLRSGKSESRVLGQLRDGLLKATLDTGDVKTPFTFPVSDDMLLGFGMGGPTMNLPILEPGQEAFLDTFDPASMSMGKARLKCTGRETIVAAGQSYDTSVIEITLGGMTTRAWVTPDQETIKAQTPVGITLQKITPEEALEPISVSERMSLLDATVVTPTGAELRRGVATLQLRLTGLEAEAQLPLDANQRSEADGTLRITSPPAPTGAGETLPDAERAANLASDPMVNAENAAVIAAAKEAIGDAQTDWDKALALYTWVYTNIDKVPTLSLPAAVDVLRTRQGDCNEHTILYTAMARSAGLPCRIAIGLVYSEVLHGFGYHAWPEVWAGQWIPMDPTLGQPIADATHLKLLNGGLEKWAGLVGYIGKIRIEVLESSGAVDTEKELPEEKVLLQQ